MEEDIFHRYKAKPLPALRQHFFTTPQPLNIFINKFFDLDNLLQLAFFYCPIKSEELLHAEQNKRSKRMTSLPLGLSSPSPCPPSSIFFLQNKSAQMSQIWPSFSDLTFSFTWLCLLLVRTITDSKRR